MHEVEPKVFLVGETRIMTDEFMEYLEHIEVPGWNSDAPSDPEKLIEFMGRLCYKSFVPGLNPNVTKIREGNDEYLANLSNVKHGSVLEHVVFNFVFSDVSRVFTHELVRHRAGVAISQESLRYVRLTEIGFMMPSVFANDPEVVEKCSKYVEEGENLQLWLAEHFGLDNPGVGFPFKKKVTSAMRRVAVLGLATTIGWSANARALRWVLEMRTHPSAEEEIRMVFGKVGEMMCAKYPNLFGDFEVVMEDGLPHYKPRNSKV